MAGGEALRDGGGWEERGWSHWRGVSMAKTLRRGVLAWPGW